MDKKSRGGRRDFENVSISVVATSCDGCIGDVGEEPPLKVGGSMSWNA